MARPEFGILVGILIFIAAGILAVFWIAKIRQERAERKPRVVYEFVYHPRRLA